VMERDAIKERKRHFVPARHAASMPIVSGRRSHHCCDLIQ
jgi:hypothetical protein